MEPQTDEWSCGLRILVTLYDLCHPKTRGDKWEKRYPHSSDLMDMKLTLLRLFVTFCEKTRVDLSS
jgi:hypothetical protein